MTVRHALPLLVVLAACSKHEAPATADTAPPPAVLATPSASAPSPFSVKAAGLPADAERFPVKLAALAWETRVMEQPGASPDWFVGPPVMEQLRVTLPV